MCYSLCGVWEDIWLFAGMCYSLCGVGGPFGCLLEHVIACVVWESIWLFAGTCDSLCGVWEGIWLFGGTCDSSNWLTVQPSLVSAGLVFDHRPQLIWCGPGMTMINLCLVHFCLIDCVCCSRNKFV
ncbi:hypothetical protein BsWGS_28496 [Bradybaena similaris]